MCFSSLSLSFTSLYISLYRCTKQQFCQANPLQNQLTFYCVSSLAKAGTNYCSKLKHTIIILISILKTFIDTNKIQSTLVSQSVSQVCVLAESFWTSFSSMPFYVLHSTSNKYSPHKFMNCNSIDPFAVKCITFCSNVHIMCHSIEQH